MIGFNDMNAMMAHLRRKPPQGGGLAAVAFTRNVGVAPGTTTMNLGCTGCSKPVDGVALAAASCPPDPLNQYMTNPPVVDVMAPVIAPVATAPTAPMAMVTTYDPYGDPVSLKGLRDAPLGLSWTSIGVLAGAAVVAGLGIGYLTHRK